MESRLSRTRRSVTPCLTAALALSLTPLVGLAESVATYTYNGSVQTFTANGDFYGIDAVGASGGNSSGHSGGHGAAAEGYFPTSPGQTWAILVGGEGANGTGTDGGGGGVARALSSTPHPRQSCLPAAVAEEPARSGTAPMGTTLPSVPTQTP